ncbi:hypothetical protein A2Y85_06010 [candidate division WOR-3 bacterium RBG_13_43_14]|uniref:DUF5668 domain-containing protein n=1 Tax=candidate division WOR-3 bacterium RBG_13_43_14 TaxID=1802590 RepID=A0A1F4U267_UNCW3|nr:MAG: hypothetical protein A2Y85_06010 [candidate division WOR-3 bacterium RBG_13_43_14]
MGCGIWTAILLMVVGGWIWASNHGITLFYFYRDWPVLLVLLGLWALIKIAQRRRMKRKLRDREQGTMK